MLLADQEGSITVTFLYGLVCFFLSDNKLLLDIILLSHIKKLPAR
jgi:hypothetical protein